MFCFLSFFFILDDARRAACSAQVLPRRPAGSPNNSDRWIFKEQQTPGERIISGERHWERGAERRVGGAGLTAGLVGRAAFFSSGLLPTFSGRCSGEPSDLEEALGRRQTAKLQQGEGAQATRSGRLWLQADTGHDPCRLSRHVTRIFKKVKVLIERPSTVPGDSQRGLKRSLGLAWELELDEPDELPLPGRGCSFSTRSHRGRWSTLLGRRKQKPFISRPLATTNIGI